MGPINLIQPGLQPNHSMWPPADSGSPSKVLHVIVGLNSGGAERTLRNLLMSDSFHRHSVVSLTSLGTYGQELLDAGISVEHLGMSRSPFGMIKGVMFLRKKILEDSPDFIQTWMYHADMVGSLAAILAGHRNLYWNLRASEPALGHTKPTTLVLRAILSALSWFVPRQIVAVGSSVKRAHANIGYRSAKITVIENGVDVERFHADSSIRNALRNSLGIPCEMPVFGLVGRFDPQKNHQGLVRAFDALIDEGHEFRIIFAGHGAEVSNPKFAELLENSVCKPYIFALGSSKNVVDVMNAIDYHVLPSKFGEGFPNVVLEAMACERPCIVSDSGDSIAITGGLGWSFNRKSFPELCVSLREALAASPEARLLIGAKSATRVRGNFSLEVMVAKYQTLYSQ